MADSNRMVTGALVVGFVFGLTLGIVTMCFVADTALKDQAEHLRDRTDLEKLCIAGNDGSCRVLEARYGR